jgi:hypothetical protein
MASHPRHWAGIAVQRAKVAVLAALVAGCTTTPPTPPIPPTPSGPAHTGATLLVPWRTVTGGFLAPPGAPFGAAARSGTGAFVRLLAPTAVALRDNDLLVVDSGAGRVWRADLALQTMSAITGAPSAPGTGVALGPDLSAWIQDRGAHQILRFARDGRLLQTYRAGPMTDAIAGFALADAGATLLVADGGQRQWLELRPVGSIALPVPLRHPGGIGVRGVDGLAVAGSSIYVLDRLAGEVHVARRDGLVTASFGRGELKQPVALAADAGGRVFVQDAQDQSVTLLQAGLPPQVFTAAQLGVQVIGGIAVQERFLVVSDHLAGQVVIHTIRNLEAR